MNKPITGASIDCTIVHLANVLESLRVEFAPGKPATGRFADALATVDELRQVVAALALENDNARGVLELLRTQGWRSEDDVVQIRARARAPGRARARSRAPRALRVERRRHARRLPRLRRLQAESRARLRARSGPFGWRADASFYRGRTRLGYGL